MRKLILVLSVLFLARASQAQTRFLVGATGGEVFDSTLFGVTAAVEAPIGRHFELDDMGEYYPVDYHTGYGHGYSYNLRSTALIWFNKPVGIFGSINTGGYTVTKAAKCGDEIFTGLVLRHTAYGAPGRFYFDYFRQILNGIAKDGTETNHIQGGEFKYDVRVGCKGPICFRTALSVKVAKFLDQGNPVCDGQFVGPITCPRTKATTGGVEASFMLEFPRRRNRENELF